MNEPPGKPVPPSSSGVYSSLTAVLAATEGKIAHIIEALDQLESGVVLYGPDDRLVFCNQRFRDIYPEIADLLLPGAAYEEITREVYRRRAHHYTTQTEDEFVAARALLHRAPGEGYELQLDAERWIYVFDRKTADGGIIGMRLDISARKRAEAQLAQSEARLKSLLEMSSDWYWEQDENFCFRHISASMVRSTGVQAEQRYGMARWDIDFRGISQEQMDAHRRVVEAHLPFRDFQYAYALPDGEVWWVSVSGAPIFDEQGVFRGYRGVGSNITEKKRIEAQVRELAELDFLTGLPNRLLLSARFDFARRQSERHQGGMALLFIDLDRFKNINDSMGHQIGDQILTETARRLSVTTRATDTVSRHGGDEFIVLLPGSAEPDTIAHVAENILHALGQPYLIEESELTVTPSIGISLWPLDGDDLGTLIQNADLAMYHSKAQGRNQFSFFRREMNERVTERLKIENALRRALQRHEFSLLYQPIFQVPERRIIGAEALLRWHSASLGPVPPARFIPVAEESGLIDAIGQWVIREAAAQLRRWRDAGMAHFPVTVNVSAVQFKHRNLIATLGDAVRQNNLVPGDIEIELTETALVSEGDTAVSTLDEMAVQGFRLVVDDFGTGYSNLGYLKRFDISKLKIDQSFVRDIISDADDAAITRGIIGLAHSLGMRVVAEGVEHEAQLDFLVAAGCREAQGNLLSIPVAAEAFQSLT